MFMCTVMLCASRSLQTLTMWGKHQGRALLVAMGFRGEESGLWNTSTNGEQARCGKFRGGIRNVAIAAARLAGYSNVAETLRFFAQLPYRAAALFPSF